ncbi:alanyl-tRNA editing protein [Candidatus Parvarchaeota archaeon]|nr:alanyl-tRNA editing protein [Candidatus Parvarchaeota archaeon]
MTKILCLENCYIKNCDAKVEMLVSPCELVLDQTAFYPRGGGVACDIGTITRKSDGKIFKVIEVSKKDGNVVHKVEVAGLNAGDEVGCEIDWERRHRLIRAHTAAHILAQATAARTGALITGNQIEPEKCRFDFSLENFDRQLMDSIVAQANLEIGKNADVKIYSLPRDEAFKIPGIVKLAGALPPSIPVLRIVEVVGIDIQADGGPHVKNTSEIGKIEIISMENKGKSNRRIYFRLVP